MFPHAQFILVHAGTMENYDFFFQYEWHCYDFILYIPFGSDWMCTYLNQSWVFFFNSYNIFNAEQSINKELKKLSHWSIKHRGGRKDSQFFFVSRWSVCLQPAFATIPKSPEKTNTTFRFILYVKFLHDKLLLTTAADWGSHVRLLPHHLHFPGFSVSLAKAVIKRAADYSAVPGDTH